MFGFLPLVHLWFRLWQSIYTASHVCLSVCVTPTKSGKKLQKWQKVSKVAKSGKKWQKVTKSGKKWQKGAKF